LRDRSSRFHSLRPAPYRIDPLCCCSTFFLNASVTAGEAMRVPKLSLMVRKKPSIRSCAVPLQTAGVLCQSLQLFGEQELKLEAAQAKTLPESHEKRSHNDRTAEIEPLRSSVHNVIVWSTSMSLFPSPQPLSAKYPATHSRISLALCRIRLEFFRRRFEALRSSMMRLSKCSAVQTVGPSYRERHHKFFCKGRCARFPPHVRPRALARNILFSAVANVGWLWQ